MRPHRRNLVSLSYLQDDRFLWGAQRDLTAAFDADEKVAHSGVPVPRHPLLPLEGMNIDPQAVGLGEGFAVIARSAALILFSRLMQILAPLPPRHSGRLLSRILTLAGAICPTYEESILDTYGV